MLSVQLSLLPGEPAPLQVQLYGVYDGHGTGFGDVVSAYIAQSLHKHFEQYLSGDLRSSSVGAAHAADARVQAALIHAFEQTDRDLMHNPMHSSASSESAGSPGLLCSSSAGSTATVAAVTDSAVYLAWAGDSRAIVLGTGVTLTCTPEHKADRQDEQDRIAAAGGRVFFNGGLRVMGMLATTRAIGDHDLRPYGVVPTPDVLKYERTGSEEYLVLASDGLWDVMSNEEVYEYAKKTWQKAGSVSLAREVGSAPPGILLGFPDGLLPLSGSTMQQTLSLALEQCNARSCGGLLDQRKSLSCPLGSSELPVAV
eukprot:gene10461-10619_t